MHLDPVIVIDLLVVLVTSHLAHSIPHTILLWVKVVLLLVIQRTKKLWLEVSVNGVEVVIVLVRKPVFSRTVRARIGSQIGYQHFQMKSLITNMSMMKLDIT